MIEKNIFEVKVLHVILVVAALWVVFLIKYFYLAQGGDSEIHIVFAKNLLTGHFLEFNQGYKTGGETSPIYMLIVALGIYIFGDNIQYVMKLISLISLLYILYLIYISYDRTTNIKKVIYTVLILSFPFIIYQTSLGMENIIFAAAVLKIVDNEYNNSQYNPFTLAIISTILFLLRPEGILIPLWLGFISLYRHNRKGLISAAISILLICISYKSLNLYTGIDILNAGKIRAYLSRTDAFHLNIIGINLYLNFKLIIASIYAYPILLLMWVYKEKVSKLDVITLLLLVLLPGILHISIFFPSTHISRYFLFEYSIIFYIFGKKILPSVNYRIFIILSTILLIFSATELYARRSIEFGDFHDSVKELKSENILEYSNLLIDKLKPESLPVSIALQEVQLRARVDNRFIIWSLDGITDSELGNHIEDDSVNHISYIKYRKIQYLWTNFENYNSNKLKPSLKSFLPFNGDSSKCIEGIILTKTMVPDIYKVNKCTN